MEIVQNNNLKSAEIPVKTLVYAILYYYLYQINTNNVKKSGYPIPIFFLKIIHSALDLLVSKYFLIFLKSHIAFLLCCFMVS